MHTDTQEAKELFLFAVDDADLYRQRITPIIDNLKRKIKKGNYDKVLALKLWRYAADDAAKRYIKEYMVKTAGYGIFTVPIRNEVSTLLQEHYDKELHYRVDYSGYEGFKENPMQTITHKGIYWFEKVEIPNGVRPKGIGWVLKKAGEQSGKNYSVWERKGKTIKNPAPRIGTAKPRRRSQATGKAPGKRLVSRRVSNTKKGYFPNPLPDKIALHFNAGNDTNRNPRRLFVVVDTRGNVISAHDEGYRGNASVTDHYPDIAIVGRFDITPAQRKSLLKEYGK